VSGSKKDVLVLGGSGMLGSMVVGYFSMDKDINVTATVRNDDILSGCRRVHPSIEWRLFDADEGDVDSLYSLIDGKKWVINAIGITKRYINDADPIQVQRAIRVNSIFPYKLASLCFGTGGQVLQIATDCVYSGSKGRYVEADPHDAEDVYGRTKSLGEVSLDNSHFLRCSFIGPEPKSYVLLLEWFRKQPKGAVIKGYLNHMWNGITTLHAAKLYHGLIKNDIKMPRLQHFIPSDDISKYELLKCLAVNYDRGDITIKPVNTDKAVDRTISTVNKELNDMLWKVSGYSRVPSIRDMLTELANYEHCIK